MMINSDSDYPVIPDDNARLWVNCWKSMGGESFQVSDEVQADLWNKRSDGFGKDGDEERQIKKTEEFFEILKKAGFSPKGANVLDIGCGPGSHSIPLAKAGATVTSLDISRGMLDRLCETAEKEGLPVRTYECSWWTADIDKLGFRNAFDLVIASKTPGIRDVETFNRMMACSRNYCYYGGFLSKHPGKIPEDIYVKILEESPKLNPLSSGFLYPFVYLYTLGIHPVINLSNRTVKFDEPWAEAADKTIESLRINQELSDETVSKIREYFRDNSVNGVYNSDYETYSGMMVWSVKSLYQGLVQE